MQEGFHPVSTQIPCGVNQVFVNFNQYIVNRQHHEWEKVINHTQNNGGRRIDNIQSRKMQGGQYGIDDPLFLQQGLPGKSTKQKIHPHGKNKNQYDKGFLCGPDIA